MNIEEYAALKDRYRMPEQVECAGNAVDRDGKHWLSIGVVTRRDTYYEAGYLCHNGADQVFHACVCALLKKIQDMPIIKTVLLTPEDIFQLICHGEDPNEEIRYCTSMALCALLEAFQGCLVMRRGASSDREPA